MVPTDEKPARADGQEVMPTIDSTPAAAPSPQSRRTVYCKETGVATHNLYSVDAREYVRTGRYQYNPVSNPAPAPEKSEGAEGVDDDVTKTPGADDDKKGEGEGEGDEATGWDDWSVRQLRAAAKEKGIKGEKSKGRDELIEALEKAGVTPKEE